MLILACLPIGDVRDASAHLIAAITNAEYVAAEDSRKFARLCQDLEIRHSAKVISFFEGNENEKIEELSLILKSGKDILVVTDAGVPAISDPGYRLIRAALTENIQIKVLPGPSAVTTALLLSGLPTDRFCFEGFPPRTSGARLKWFTDLSEQERTIIFFEAPHRLVDSLLDCVNVFGPDRHAAICREMTKRYEETIRGNLKELSAWATNNEVLGEITLVIAGAVTDSASLTAADMVARVREFESAGMDRKGAIATVADEFGIAKRLVYAAVVDANKMSQ